MTRAKDISKIVTDADLSGTLDVTGEVNLSANLNLGDNDKAIFGAGSDLQIFHNGTHSYVSDEGTGNLILRGSNELLLGTTAGQDILKGTTGGDVKIYYNNSQKLATTSTGIDVTGNITFGDSHTIGDDGSDNLEIATSVGENLILASSGNVNTFLDTNEDQSTASFQIHSGTTSSTHKLLRVEETGDISFYEDTGTTAKLFWDSSAERLGIGTSSPDRLLHIYEGNSGITPNSSAHLTLESDGANFFNILKPNGTVGGIAFSGNSTNADGRITYDDGISRAMQFYTASTERMRITSAGNVGIGESNPVAKTHIQGSGTSGQVTASLILENSSSGTAGVDITGSAGSSRLRFLYGGGPSTGTNALTEAMSIVLEGGSAGEINHHTSGSFKIYRFNSSTNPYLNVGSIGCAYFNASSTDANAYAIVTNKDSSSTMHHICFKNINSVVGTISTSGSSTSYNTSSDHRLKENVVEMTDATTRLKQLQPKRFNFIADADTTVDGFLAHEVQSVVPEAITGTHNEVDADGNPVYQGIDQSKLVPLLVKTIQELEARIVALETA